MFHRLTHGVSSITFCSKLHIGFAFLKDTHHCKVSRNSSNGFRNDSSTLITQEEQPDSSSLQFLQASALRLLPILRYRRMPDTRPSAAQSLPQAVLPQPPEKPLPYTSYPPCPVPIPYHLQYLRKKERESTLPLPERHPDDSSEGSAFRRIFPSNNIIRFPSISVF